MSDNDFSYHSAEDAAGLRAGVAIFADRAGVRHGMAEDMEAAGFRVLRSAPLQELLEGEATSLGDVVLLDCISVDVKLCAALSLLDLTAAHGEGVRVSVTSLCIASGVPPTTALRWVRQMTENGLFERIDDPSDKRRAFISLSAKSRDAMSRYFALIEAPLAAAA